MTTTPLRKCLRCLVPTLGVLLLTAWTSPAQNVDRRAPCRMEDLEGLRPCELDALFRAAEVGQPLVGVVPSGRLLVAVNTRTPRLKVRLSNAVWRGKTAEEDGYYVNRWIGGIQVIDSHYVLGESWIDGKPAVIMQYAPGTPLFANLRDELREVAPGLYMGPIFERCPCPKLAGYIALQRESCPRR